MTEQQIDTIFDTLMSERRRLKRSEDAISSIIEVFDKIVSETDSQIRQQLIGEVSGLWLEFKKTTENHSDV
jgi:hypothetical protein